MRANRDEVLLQSPSNQSTKFRLGYFSPKKQQVPQLDAEFTSDVGSPGEDEDHQSPDSEQFSVPRWSSPPGSLGCNELGNNELTVPLSPSRSATLSTLSNADSELEQGLNMPHRKKKKTTHISADKALILENAQCSTDARQPCKRKEVNYARVKRTYTKKHE